jgi:hypothetical protein
VRSIVAAVLLGVLAMGWRQVCASEPEPTGVPLALRPPLPPLPTVDPCEPYHQSQEELDNPDLAADTPTPRCSPTAARPSN